MARSASIVELARQLLECTEEIETYNGLPESADLPIELKKARTNVLELSQELEVRVRGPSEFLEHCQIQYQAFSCLRWLLYFDIFALVPSDYTPISYTDLADAASVAVARLRSVTRMTMTSGFFAEPEAGFVSHNGLSMAFAKDAALRDWSSFITNYGAPSAACFTEATRTWGDTSAKNETAFNIFADTPLPFFDHVRQRPGMAEEFSRYMQSQGRSEGARLEHVLEGYDWARLGSQAHIVDVGGSTGFVSVVLANAHHGFTFTVQDLPEAIESSHSTLASLPPPVAASLRFVEHDFFNPQPPATQDSPSADAYLLRKILHDWPDERARDILSQLAAAIRAGDNPGGRIIVMDTILPPPGTVGRIQEAGLRVRDLTMAQNFNSKERELGEWEELFSRSVPKLKLFGWKQPPGSVMAMMDVGLAD